MALSAVISVLSFLKSLVESGISVLSRRKAAQMEQLGHVTFELDFDRSRVLVITEADRPEVAGFKTRNRIELRIWLHFVDTKESLITTVKLESFRERRLWIYRRVGKTIQPTKEISKIIDEDGVLTAPGKSQYYMFKWTITLPKEPKNLSASKCFIRIISSAHGQPNYQKDFDVEWLDSRIGRFKPF